MVKTYIAVKEEQNLLWEIPCLLVGENITQGEEAVLAESIKFCFSYLHRVWKGDKP